MMIETCIHKKKNIYRYIGTIECDRMDISQLMREFTALQAAWQVPVVSKDLSGHQAAEGMCKQLKCRVSTQISYIVLRVLLV